MKWKDFFHEISFCGTKGAQSNITTMDGACNVVLQRQGEAYPSAVGSQRGAVLVVQADLNHETLRHEYSFYFLKYFLANQRLPGQNHMFQMAVADWSISFN